MYRRNGGGEEGARGQPEGEDQEESNAPGQALPVVETVGPGRFHTCDMVKMPF